MDELLSVLVPRDFVQVTGTDAATFLQGQLSQDIERLSVGNAAWSFLLQPQGKVDAWLRVTRVADNAFVVDVDGGCVDAVLDAAQPVQAAGEGRAVGPRLALSRVSRTGRGGRGARRLRRQATRRAFAVDAEWPGIEAFDVIGPADSASGPGDCGLRRAIRAGADRKRCAGDGSGAHGGDDSGRVRSGRAISELHKGLLHRTRARRPHRRARRQRAASRASSARRGRGAAGSSRRCKEGATSAWSRAVRLLPTAASPWPWLRGRSNLRPKCG